MFRPLYIYSRVNCTEEGWIDLNTTNHIDQTDMEKCPISKCSILTQKVRLTSLNSPIFFYFPV